MDIVANVNWFAVIVGAVAAYAIGWIWYGPVFGKAWSTGLGISMPEKMPIGAMAMQAVATFLLAWVFGITAAANALALIILIVLAIVVLMISGGMYAQKPARVNLIDAGYVVVMAVIMFAAQAIF